MTYINLMRPSFPIRWSAALVGLLWLLAAVRLRGGEWHPQRSQIDRHGTAKVAASRHLPLRGHATRCLPSPSLPS